MSQNSTKNKVKDQAKQLGTGHKHQKIELFQSRESKMNHNKRPGGIKCKQFNEVRN